MPTHRRASRAAVTLTAAALAVTGLSAPAYAGTADPLSPAAAPPSTTTDAAPSLDDGLIAHYPLTETSGTTATDTSGNGNNGTVSGTAGWNGGDGFTFSGGSSSSGNAIALPNNLLAGQDDVTVDFDVQVDSTLTGTYFIFNLGNLSTYPNGTGYLFVTSASSTFRGTLATAGYATEQSASRSGALTTNIWKHVTLAVHAGTSAAPGYLKLYEDGAVVATNPALTQSPAQIGEPDGTSTRNVLGRSSYSGDPSFKGKIRDFRIYQRVLGDSEVAQLAADVNDPTLAADSAALTLGDTSNVTGDLTLPTKGSSTTSTITWATDRCDVVASNGTVYAPADPVDVVLTATLTRGSSSVTKAFTVHIAAATGDVTDVAAQVAAGLSIPDIDDIRGNITLPADGTACSKIVWESSDPAVISTTGEVQRPATGSPAAEVELTATVTHGSNVSVRRFDATVPALPEVAEHSAYLFTYFVGETTDDGEKIYFGASKGNDALHWNDLNDGHPVLTSTKGTTGLRDPFIIRSPEGDKFYLLATDLKIYPGGSFSTAQQTGSLYLEIWESDDLIHWGDQRHIKVSTDYAGNTWAPEAYYDSARGLYVVYWASNLYSTTSTAGRSYTSTYNRMMMATTRDFVTFTPAQPWVDVKRGTGLGVIDATVIADGGTYYRFEKDEASMTIRQEKSTDLLATVSGALPTETSTPGWQLVKEKVGIGQPNQWGGTVTGAEGPLAFKANPGDVNTGNEDTWYLFMDQPSYHGGKGYVPFTSTDLGSGTWTSVATRSELPTSPRHGTVLPVTQAEYQRLLQYYQPDLLTTSVDPVSVTTRQGVEPVLPTTVTVHFADGSSSAQPVTWDAIDPASYVAPGTFTVSGSAVAGSSIPALATVRVTDTQDPLVTIAATPAAPNGQNGWYVAASVPVTVSATDETGVAAIDAEVDGAAWSTTSGSSVTLTVTGEGSHEVRGRATDVTGNVSAPSTASVKIDSVNPVSKAVVDSSARTVTLIADDDTSGVAHIEYRLGTSGAWSNYTAPLTAGTALTTVTYRSVDRAGNTELINTAVVPKIGVTLAPSATAALITPTVIGYGTSAKVTVRVTGSGGTPTGTVRVLDGSKVVGTGSLVAGRATVTLAKSVPVGTHHLVVRYSGDARFDVSSDTVILKVTKAASTSAISVSPAKVTARTAATVTVKITSTVRATGAARVVITKSGRVAVSKSATVATSGKATVKLPKLAAGSYRITATYSGSATVAASTKTVILTVTR